MYDKTDINNKVSEMIDKCLPIPHIRCTWFEPVESPENSECYRWYYKVELVCSDWDEDICKMVLFENFVENGKSGHMPYKRDSDKLDLFRYGLKGKDHAKQLNIPFYIVYGDVVQKYQ